MIVFSNFYSLWPLVLWFLGQEVANNWEDWSLSTSYCQSLSEVVIKVLLVFFVEQLFRSMSWWHLRCSPVKPRGIWQESTNTIIILVLLVFTYALLFQSMPIPILFGWLFTHHYNNVSSDFTLDLIWGYVLHSTRCKDTQRLYL